MAGLSDPTAAAGSHVAAGRRTNREIAARLREAADLLEHQGANPFRLQAYRRAAATAENLDRRLAAPTASAAPATGW
jgi:DNA polymerase/3'-5' exonuclease PolX